MRRILYQGRKSFWRLKTSVEIVIVEYSYLDVFEVLVYDTLADFEAEPVYVCAIALRAILQARQRVILTEATAGGVYAVKTSTAYDEEISTFICHHLLISTYLPVSKCMEIVVRATYADEGDSELMVPRPEELQHMRSPFRRDEREGFQFERELWRKPLIMTRVLKGLPLTEQDAKIWQRFALGKTEAELLQCMIETLAQHVPESEKVLQNATQATMLPAQTPFPAPRLKAPSVATLPCELTMSCTSSPTSVALPLRLAARKCPVSAHRLANTEQKRTSLLGNLFSIATGDAAPAGGMAGLRSRSETMFATAAEADAPARPATSLRNISSLGDLAMSVQRTLGTVRRARSYDDCSSLYAETDDDLDHKVLSGYSTDDDEQAVGCATPSANAGGASGLGQVRRHTFDAVRAPLSEIASAASANAVSAGAHQQHHRTGSGSILASFVNFLTSKDTVRAEELKAHKSTRAEKKQHRRNGSGGLLAGIAGPSNRVQPTATVEDDGAELD